MKGPRMCIECRDTVAREDRALCRGCAWRANLGVILAAGLQALSARTQSRKAYLDLLETIADMLFDHAEQRAELEQAIKGAR